MFLIIDGSSLLVTAYYGNLPRSILFEKDEEKKKTHYGEILHSDDGRYTNAVYTMIKQILKILEKQKPEQIAFVFDKTRDTFRREMYQDYKGNRGDTPDPLKEQFVTMESMLEKAGFKVFYSDEFEADDFAGSLVEKFKGQTAIRLLSKDHDYLQLVSAECTKEDVRCWMLMSSQDKANEYYDRHILPIYGKDFVNAIKNIVPDKTFEFSDAICFAEEGVHANQIADKKGISGDTADNIPGIKGIADKTTVPLLNEYESLEGIYEKLDSLEDEKQEKELAAYFKTKLGISRNPIKLLKEGREMAELSKKLATIRRDIEIEESLDDFSLRINKDAWMEDLASLNCVSLISEVKKL